MTFEFKPMTQQEAEEIANTWQYPGEYSFYNADADEEDYAEFINPATRGDGNFSGYIQNELSAFYSVDIVDGNKAEIGLGLKPDLTGKGYGLNFINAIMADITSRCHVADFTLSVALFNQRAIKVYKQAGFKEAGIFKQDTNGATYDFLRMTKIKEHSSDTPTDKARNSV